MVKRLSLLVAAAAVLLATSYANQPKSKFVIPMERTNPTDGKQMYVAYCAPCHGMDGRGHGPAAIATKTQPVDLTLLARMNHGKYPDSHVATMVRYGTDNTVNSSAYMPAWGTLLAKLTNVNKQQETDLRISNLSRYVHSIQVR